jgi:hypothetical protein
MVALTLMKCTTRFDIDEMYYLSQFDPTYRFDPAYRLSFDPTYRWLLL